MLCAFEHFTALITSPHSYLHSAPFLFCLQCSIRFTCTSPTLHHGRRRNRAVRVDSVSSLVVSLSHAERLVPSIAATWAVLALGAGKACAAAQRHPTTPTLPFLRRLLAVTVESAKDLKNVDWIGQSDPYFKVSICGSGHLH